jgi:hypothetical protein
LKRNGFRENILINIYKSLALSHFNYSSTILAATSIATKHEMSCFQNRVLRIINITPERALTEYGLLDIDEQLEKACFDGINRILSNPNSRLTEELPTTTRTNSLCRLRIPMVRSEKFKRNSVNKAFRRLRDSKVDLYTSESMTPITRRRAAPSTDAEMSITGKPLAACRYCEKKYVGVKIHGNKCRQKSNHK